jgi:hypothetical protein
MAMGTGARASSWPVVEWTRRGPWTASRRRGQKNLRPHEKQRRDSLGSPKNQAPRLGLGLAERSELGLGGGGRPWPVGRGCHCLPRRAWLLAGHPHMRPVTGGRAPPRWRPPVRYQIDPLVAAAPARCHDPRTIAWNLREREGRRWGIAIFSWCRELSTSQ